MAGLFGQRAEGWRRLSFFGIGERHVRCGARCFAMEATLRNLSAAKEVSASLD
jgi:hypothetical protein